MAGKQSRDAFIQGGSNDVGPSPELLLEPHWYACRTRARAEKQVDRLLAGSGFETYLPLVEQVRQWADRKKRVAFPLFPGYTFARFTLADTLKVVQTAGLVSVLSGSGRGHPMPVREEELESVKIMVDGISRTREAPEPAGWDRRRNACTGAGRPLQGHAGSTAGGTRPQPGFSSAHRHPDGCER